MTWIELVREFGPAVAIGACFCSLAANAVLWRWCQALVAEQRELIREMVGAVVRSTESNRALDRRLERVEGHQS